MLRNAQATRVFRDRRAAGRELAAALKDLPLRDPIVIGLPRGGVPVAYEVARALEAPLDVLVARKVGAPGNPELAMGAIAEGGVRVLDDRIVRALLVSHEELAHALQRAGDELEQRRHRYRGAEDALSLAGRDVVVVDDGLATGATARAALRAARARSPRRLVLAVPVGSHEAVDALQAEADDIVCVLVPEMMWAVGVWYETFGQTSDREVTELLERARADRRGGQPGARAEAGADPPGATVTRDAVVPLEDTAGRLHGDLVLPPAAAGVVVFAHGSGSSRHSPRNRRVAEVLNGHGLATLLLDLLTVEEERDRRNVFDIPLLAGRLVAATAWVHGQPEVDALPIGFFGASTGAGAALWAAAELGDAVGAVVSRGGRPDLAGRRLHDVVAPVLLIVGGDDRLVLELNRMAAEELRGERQVAVVPGATHLFEEPGTLDQAARLATEWFARHLVGGAARAQPG